MKFRFIIFLIIIINGCAYEPMYSKREYKFGFKNINFNGEREINELIERNLTKRSTGNKVFDLKFSTEKNREIISSNAKGDPTIFKLNINLNYIVFKNDKEILNDEIKKQITYNNIDDKFELNKYEESIIKNISESLSDEMLISIISKN
tara:strand:+ start:956 stop:1402 length:447 start_codon:yes stop_codon:yes gene_type:complete